MVSDTGSGTASDMAPEYHTPATHPARSHLQHEHDHDPNRHKSDNYSQALKDRAIVTTTESSIAEPRVVAGLAYRGNNADATASRPGVLGRQQSWKTSDQKRANMETMLRSDGPKTAGYTSTATGKQ